MAIPDGKPATDFSAMNREWVRAVAEEVGGGGIPAPENPSDGDVLTYDSTDGEWKAEAPSGGGGIPAPDSPSNGDVLTYDSTAEEWVAAAPGGGGGGATMLTLTYTENDDILSATGQEIITAMRNGPVFLEVTNILESDPPTEFYYYSLASYIFSDDPHDAAHVFSFGDGNTYYANSLSDYPQNPAPPLPGE